MEKALNLFENDINTSDKVTIERLKYESEDFKNSITELEKKISHQSWTISEQQKIISDAFKTIKQNEVVLEHQQRIVNFLNDWKFKDKRFQTDLKSTCEN